MIGRDSSLSESLLPLVPIALPVTHPNVPSVEPFVPSRWTVEDSMLLLDLVASQSDPETIAQKLNRPQDVCNNWFEFLKRARFYVSDEDRRSNRPKKRGDEESQPKYIEVTHAESLVALNPMGQKVH